MKKIIFRIAICVIATAVLCAAAVLGMNVYMKNKVKNRIFPAPEAYNNGKADCIVVLGAAVYDNGTLSYMLRDRLDYGIALYKDGAAPKLVMSGDHGREHYDEVNAMKDYAVSCGVPSEDIFMDHAGFSTYDSMYRAKEIFGAENLIVVTQKYHLYRALYIGDKLGIDVCGVSSDQRQYAGQARREVREMLARCKDMVKVMARQKPQYLGEAIPLWNNGDVTNDK